MTVCQLFHRTEDTPFAEKKNKKQKTNRQAVKYLTTDIAKVESSRSSLFPLSFLKDVTFCVKTVQGVFLFETVGSSGFREQTLLMVIPSYVCGIVVFLGGVVQVSSSPVLLSLFLAPFI